MFEMAAPSFLEMNHFRLVIRWKYRGLKGDNP